MTRLDSAGCSSVRVDAINRLLRWMLCASGAQQQHSKTEKVKDGIDGERGGGVVRERSRDVAEKSKEKVGRVC